MSWENTETRQCTLCGRKGKAGWAKLGGSGVVCAAARSCRKRRAAYLRRFEKAADRA